MNRERDKRRMSEHGDREGDRQLSNLMIHKKGLIDRSIDRLI